MSLETVLTSPFLFTMLCNNKTLGAQISEVGMTLEGFALLDIKSARVRSCLLTSLDTLSVQFQGSTSLPCVTHQKCEGLNCTAVEI